MANEKVWTEVQLAQANVPLWQRFSGIPVDHAAAQVLQCELTEAVELLTDYMSCRHLQGSRVADFLKRNTGGQ